VSAPQRKAVFFIAGGLLERRATDRKVQVGSPAGLGPDRSGEGGGFLPPSSA
jgi:hypothetical protein